MPNIISQVKIPSLIAARKPKNIYPNSIPISDSKFMKIFKLYRGM